MELSSDSLLDQDKDHITFNQLIRVHNDEVQYCTIASSAPFQVINLGNDPSTIVDFCWRGPRESAFLLSILLTKQTILTDVTKSFFQLYINLWYPNAHLLGLPTHKANCTGCDCAHWQLQLGADGKSMKSVMWQSHPVIHFEIDLIKTNTTRVSTEEVIDGWDCEFSNSTGVPFKPPFKPPNHVCPYLKLQSKKERSKSSLSLPDTNIDTAKKLCLKVSNYDTVHDAELDYTIPQVPCMPYCNVSFVFSVLTDEGDYVALGFRGYNYAYQDWNNQTADENRESGGFPDYFGMSTSSNWESKKYGPQGKSALVLFCCVLWCVQYEDSAIRILHLNLVCLYVIAFASRMY